MTKKQAMIYVVGGMIMAVGGFVVAGPSVPNFWLWMTLPAIMVAGGTIRLMRG